jgi:hypothetical protein
MNLEFFFSLEILFIYETGIHFFLNLSCRYTVKSPNAQSPNDPSPNALSPNETCPNRPYVRTIFVRMSQPPNAKLVRMRNKSERNSSESVELFLNKYFFIKLRHRKPTIYSMKNLPIVCINPLIVLKLKSIKRKTCTNCAREKVENSRKQLRPFLH